MGPLNNAIVDKDRLSFDEVEHLHGTSQIVSYRPDNHRIRLDFYAVKHGIIKIALVDKDRLSLDKVEDLYETGQIVSCRPENRIIAFDSDFTR